MHLHHSLDLQTQIVLGTPIAMWVEQWTAAERARHRESFHAKAGRARAAPSQTGSRPSSSLVPIVEEGTDKRRPPPRSGPGGPPPASSDEDDDDIVQGSTPRPSQQPVAPPPTRETTGRSSAGGGAKECVRHPVSASAIESPSHKHLSLSRGRDSARSRAHC